MAEIQRIDFSKLLGFDTVGEFICEGVDFHGDIFGARLGAKVGADNEPSPARDAEISGVRSKTRQ